MAEVKRKPLTEGQRMAAKRRGGKVSRKKQGRTGLEFVTVRYNLRTIEGDEFTRRYG
jgi:hypothetical protein